jgi:cytochrome c biogenesis protein CcdA
MDLSDDLKYYFTKILSFLVVIGLIIFFVIFGAGFFSILTIQNTFLDKISRIIYGIFFFGTGIWILCIGGFLGLRQRRRANGIFIWNK